MSPSDSSPRIFEADYYQRLYDIEERHWWSRGMQAALMALLDGPLAQRRNLRVLDAGCGTGYHLELARRFGVAGEVVGLDYSLHALRFCRRRGAGCLLQASASVLPVADETLDLILCLDTVQHLSPAGADVEALGEFARALAPGGVLFVRTNSALGHRRLEGADPDRYRRYRTRELAGLMEAAGLDVERATYLNCLPSVWAALREWRHPAAAHVPASGPTLEISLLPHRRAWLNRLLQGVLELEADLLRLTPLTLGFGHSLAVLARKPYRRKA